MIIEFTIEEMQDQVQNDLQIISYIGREEYFNFFCKIHPKDDKYKGLFENTLKLYNSNTVSIKDILKYWLNELKELNKNG